MIKWTNVSQNKYKHITPPTVASLDNNAMQPREMSDNQG